VRREERVVSDNASPRSVEPVLSALRDQGAVYSPVAKLPGGAWGAWLVRDERDEVAILKCIWDSDWRLRLESARQVVELLRTKKAPVPRYLAAGFDPEIGTWYVQERLRGTRVEELDLRLLGEVASFIDLQAGLGTNLSGAFDWSSRLEEWMAAQADSTIEVMQSHSSEGRNLAPRLESIIAAHGDEHVHSEDVVHGDLLATQLLVEGGHLSGVVDWDGAGRGDRCQDLALLFYNAFAQADRHEHPMDHEVMAALGAHGVALCGAERFGWFLAYEILVTFAFVFERNPGHVRWRTDLGQRVIEGYMEAALSGS
jgi:Phosphotransferase enzyme family